MLSSTPSVFEIFKLRQILNYQYGHNVGDYLINENENHIKIIRSKQTKRIKNVYINEKNIVNLRAKDGYYIITIESSKIILDKIKKPFMRLIVSDEAIPYIRKGYSLFCKYVENGDFDLYPGDTVILVDKNDKILGIGKLVLNLEEIKSLKRGIAAKPSKIISQ